MTIPDRLTLTRIVLAPVFYLVYSIPDWTGQLLVPSVVVLWIIFLVIEVTDLLDGMVARRRKLVTDVGKLFDPFADVISRVTYFICFFGSGFMPSWVLLVIVYREVSIGFLRSVMSRRGITVQANWFGKAKALVYSLSSAVALFLLTIIRTGVLRSSLESMVIVVRVGLMVAAAASAASLLAYLWNYRAAVRAGDK